MCSLDAPLDPANANRYAYAANDPINLSDATGTVTGQCILDATFVGVAYAGVVISIVGVTTASAGTATIAGVGLGLGVAGTVKSGFDARKSCAE